MVSLSHTEEIVGEYLKYLKDEKSRQKYIVAERISIPTKKESVETIRKNFQISEKSVAQ